SAALPSLPLSLLFFLKPYLIFFFLSSHQDKNPNLKQQQSRRHSFSLSLSALCWPEGTKETPPISDDGRDRRPNNEIDGTTSRPAVAPRSGDMQRKISVREGGGGEGRLGEDNTAVRRW
ncbi:hypothetical protein LINPERPRIM_LOCUS4052, partial [Linum perenne]